MTKLTTELGEQYNAKYPFIWKIFEREVLKAIKRGSRHESAKYIFETMRRSYKDLETTETFKLNNDFSAFYARKFVAAYPQYKHIFETRDSVFDKIEHPVQLQLSL